MNSKHAALAATLAVVLSAPAFAAGPVMSSSGNTVTSGTGVIVTPGVPTASVTVTPSTSVAIPSANLLPGGTMVQRDTTTVLGGPGPGISGSKTVVTDYWVNVPAGAERRADFQRWQSLR